MGFFSNLFAGKGGGESSKPNKRFDVNTGHHKIQVQATNGSQDLLRKINTGSGMTFCLTELTPEQLAEGWPPKNCLNVNAGKNVKENSFETWLGYIDPDRGKAKYLRKLVEEYQVVNVHGRIETKKEKARMYLLVQEQNKDGSMTDAASAGAAK